MDLKKLEDDVLIEELLSRGFIRILWHKDDITKVAEEMEVTLTDDEISAVMNDMEQSHDANYGVNWGFIEDIVNMVVEDRKK